MGELVSTPTVKVQAVVPSGAGTPSWARWDDQPSHMASASGVGMGGGYAGYRDEGSRGVEKEVKEESNITDVDISGVPQGGSP